MNYAEKHAREVNSSMVHRIVNIYDMDCIPPKGEKTYFATKVYSDYDGLYLYPEEWALKNHLTTGEIEVSGEKRRIVISALFENYRINHGFLRVPDVQGGGWQANLASGAIRKVFSVLNLNSMYELFYYAPRDYFAGVWINAETAEQLMKNLKLRPTKFCDFDSGVKDGEQIGLDELLNRMGLSFMSDLQIQAGLHYDQPYESSDDTCIKTFPGRLLKA